MQAGAGAVEMVRDGVWVAGGPDCPVGPVCTKLLRQMAFRDILGRPAACSQAPRSLRMAKSDMLAPALRPRSVGEILDTAFQLYRSRWKEMATATGVLVLPILLLEIVVPLNLLGFVERISQLFFLAASAAVVVIAAGAYRGEDVDAVDAIR